MRLALTMKANKLFLLLFCLIYLVSCSQKKTEGYRQQTQDSSTEIGIRENIKVNSFKTEYEEAKLFSFPVPIAEKESSESTILKQETINSLSEVYKNLEKKQQIITISAQKDTTIFFKEGTQISFRAGSFVSEKSGKEVKGVLKIEVKEYYKMSDILLANLSTSSEDRLLESGGMINISVSSNNENCILKSGETIEIGFPAKEKQPDMKLFSGTWKSENHIDWQVMEPPGAGMIFTVAEQMPSFVGGDSAMKSFISKRMKYSWSEGELEQNKITHLTFFIDTMGRPRNVHVIAGRKTEISKQAISIIESMPNWIPGKLAGRNVNVQMNISMRYFLEGTNGVVDYGGRLITSTTATENFRHNANLVTYNLLSSSKLGWINCDRFVDPGMQMVNYNVSTEAGSNSVVNIIFHKYKSVLSGNLNGSKFSFKGVPKGEKITILAVAYKDSIPYLGIKEGVTKLGDDEEQIDINIALTEETLLAEMNKLDRFY